jgi:hypothetical protein
MLCMFVTHAALPLVLHGEGRRGLVQLRAEVLDLILDLVIRVPLILHLLLQLINLRLNLALPLPTQKPSCYYTRIEPEGSFRSQQECDPTTTRGQSRRNVAYPVLQHVLVGLGNHGRLERAPTPSAHGCRLVSDSLGLHVPKVSLYIAARARSTRRGQADPVVHRRKSPAGAKRVLSPQGPKGCPLRTPTGLKEDHDQGPRHACPLGPKVGERTGEARPSPTFVTWDHAMAVSRSQDLTGINHMHMDPTER